MATYYLNPYTTTNGTGTFASPWSASSTTRTGLTSGDEIRILGNTNPLLFSTVYTANRTSETTITITSGGGLGADWVGGNIAYVVEDDVFLFVGSVSANVLTVMSSLMLYPWSNTATNSTRTIRRMDTANNPVSTSGSTLNILAQTNIANVVVSDAWIDASTRITDGSVKSIFRTSGTGGLTLHFETSGTPTRAANLRFNMENSYLLHSNSSSFSVSIKGRDSVYNFNQFTNYQSFTQLLTLGVATYPCVNNNITFKTVSFYNTLCTTPAYIKDSIINFTNFYSYIADAFLFGNATTIPPYFSNNVVNITNLTGQSFSSSGWFTFGGCPIADRLTINYSGILDLIPTSTPATVLVGGGGNISINMLPGTTVFRNRRASTGATALTNRYGHNASVAFTSKKIPIYAANLFPTMAATNNVGSIGSTIYSTTATSTNIFPEGDLKKPAIINIEFPSGIESTNTVQSTVQVNILQTYRDGSRDPIEILGIDTKIPYLGTAVATAFPNVFRDTVTFRTTSPSLRSLLTTRTAAYWQPSANAANISDYKSSSYKNIKIPIVSGSSYTVTGYVRSSYSLSVTGDVVMSVIYNNSVLATQNMTSAMFNSWEQFTLSFTATATGEAYLVWEMYYPTGNMSYWLDDLTITRT